MLSFLKNISTPRKEIVKGGSKIEERIKECCYLEEHLFFNDRFLWNKPWELEHSEDKVKNLLNGLDLISNYCGNYELKKDDYGIVIVFDKEIFNITEYDFRSLYTWGWVVELNFSSKYCWSFRV